MGDDDQRLAGLTQLGDSLQTLALEGLVADGKDLVDEEDIGVAESRPTSMSPATRPRTPT